MDKARKKRIEQEVAQRADDISALDEDFVGEVIGIAQASGQLREALDKLDRLIGQREYEEAANLGYKDIASEFIFLQRCLGGLNDTTLQKQSLVSDTIVRIGSGLEKLAYEEVAPFVEEKMQSLKPREPRKIEDVDFLLEIDADLIAWFKAQGGDHKVHMVDVLRRHYVSQKMLLQPEKGTVR